MISWFILIVAVPSFFAALYFSSQEKTSTLHKVLWTVLSLVSLVSIAASIVQIVIPDFFIKK